MQVLISCPINQIWRIELICICKWTSSKQETISLNTDWVKSMGNQSHMYMHAYMKWNGMHMSYP